MTGARGTGQSLPNNTHTHTNTHAESGHDLILSQLLQLSQVSSAGEACRSACVCVGVSAKGGVDVCVCGEGGVVVAVGVR